MKHLLKLGDLSPEEILHVLDVADTLKKLHRQGSDPKDLAGKSVALIFGKNSTRTRTSFEVGIYQMGGLGTFLNAATELQIARGEPIQDTARVLGRYYDAIIYRTYKQSEVEALAQWSGVPVISGMTDYGHPLQVLADLMTVRERKGRLEGLKAGFIGDGYNMANSLIVGCLKAGMTMVAACPKGYRPAADVLMMAKQYGDRFRLVTDPDEAARDADVLFTDVWQHGHGAGDRPPPPGFCGLLCGRTAPQAGKGRLHGAASPARPPGGGDHRRGAGSPCRRDLRRGGKPSPCGEGRAVHSAGRTVSRLPDSFAKGDWRGNPAI